MGTNILRSNLIGIKSYPALAVLSPGSVYAFFQPIKIAKNPLGDALGDVLPWISVWELLYQ
jgi:hypothetical protein